MMIAPSLFLSTCFLILLTRIFSFLFAFLLAFVRCPSSKERGLIGMASPASSSRSAAARVLQRQTGARAFSTSAQTCAEPSSSSTSSPSRGRKPRPQRANVLPPYPEWVSGQGKAYESAPVGRGPFWIGSTPFPLNPTFNPPPPLSQAVRDQMWSLHSQNPSANSVRVLSGRFGVQMERVTAVLRLKALEHEFVKKVSFGFPRSHCATPVLG